jgi:glycosyltransferase involved in cell wall biosynthesis
MGKRVLVFAGYFHPHIGGYETALHQLVTRMAKAGYEVTVVTCNTDRALAIERIGGVTVHRLPAWDMLKGGYPVPKPTLATFRTLRRLSRVEFDLVHTNTRFFTTSVLGMLFARLTGTPLVHVEHGSTHTVVASPVVNVLSKMFDHTLGSLVATRACRVVCSSGAAERFLRHLGVKGRIGVLPIAGVDTSVFSAEERAAGRQRKVDMGLEGALVITSVCRLIYAKGVQDLLSAMPAIKQGVPNARLLVVGDGPYRPHLEKLAAACADSVRFLGRLDHEQVAGVLAVTDILVHPSYSEASIALPVLEAGAMGVPSVSTDVGGVRELLADGQTALIARAGSVDDLGAKALRLLRETSLREAIGRQIRQLVEEKYSSVKIASAFIAEIESIPEAAPATSGTTPGRAIIKPK